MIIFQLVLQRGFGLSFLLSFLLVLSPSAFAIPFKGTKIVMTAADRYAVEAGQKIAEAGGNPVDVAITIALTMAVTNPAFASLGGGGFAMVKMAPNKVEALDFREKAPQSAGPDFYLTRDKDASVKGGTAIGVPGIPAGLWELHRRYGQIHWSRLFDTAIRLAENGFRVTAGWVEDTTDAAANFNPKAKALFLKNGKVPAPGDKIVQKGLARLLREMRNRNIVPFYAGMAAQDIVKSVRAAGGVITLEDLKSYKPIWRTPLKTDFEGHTIYLMPPPSSGGVILISQLKMIEKMKVKSFAPLSADELHYLAEISSRAFRARSLLGDPDFVTNPIQELTSEKYIDSLISSIKSDKATTIEPLMAPPNEGNNTTHISVMDSKGRGVAMTITLNLNYGSGVATNEYGIVLNNEMDDFTTRPGEANAFGLVQGKNNEVAPGKRPLSSMSPTLVEKNGDLVMALGAPGGPRIITAVLNTLYRVLAHGMDLDRAIQMPRVHHQFLPNKLFVDSDHRFAPESLAALRARKHDVTESWMGLAYAVYKKDGVLNAAYDSRGEGHTGGF